MYIADSAGTTYTFYPMHNQYGQSTLGLNFSYRPYFTEMQKQFAARHIRCVYSKRLRIRTNRQYWLLLL